MTSISVNSFSNHDLGCGVDYATLWKPGTDRCVGNVWLPLSYLSKALGNAGCEAIGGGACCIVAPPSG